jgi:hypothetical protein
VNQCSERLLLESESRLHHCGITGLVYLRCVLALFGSVLSWAGIYNIVDQDWGLPNNIGKQVFLIFLGLCLLLATDTMTSAAGVEDRRRSSAGNGNGTSTAATTTSTSAAAAAAAAEMAAVGGAGDVDADDLEQGYNGDSVGSSFTDGDGPVGQSSTRCNTVVAYALVYLRGVGGLAGIVILWVGLDVSSATGCSHDALVTFFVFFFYCLSYCLLPRWCECSCDVHLCSLHSTHANLHAQIMQLLTHAQ